MRMFITAVSLFHFCALFACVTLVHAGEYPHAGPAKRYIETHVAPWLSTDVIQNALKKQNENNRLLSRKQILKLDKQWRAEINKSDKPLINKVLSNDLSVFLIEKKREADGKITEIFVMDARGLNVGQSNITSDYWQGDEDKWRKSFLLGPDKIFVDRIMRDDSTRTFQAQVSMTIKDESGRPVGAITLGLNVDAL